MMSQKRTYGICSMCTTNVREIPTVVAATGQRRHTTQNFPPCKRTTQVSRYTLDQQEEMATVLAVLRSRQVSQKHERTLTS